MDTEEAVLIAACSTVAQVGVLLAESDDAPRGAKTQIRTVTVLNFEPILQSHMQPDSRTIFAVRRRLSYGSLHFYKTIVTTSLLREESRSLSVFLGSTGGYQELAAAMGMSRSYVLEVTNEVVRVLKSVAGAVISFPCECQECDAIESGFAERHVYHGVVGTNDVSFVEIERPDDFDGFYCRKYYPALNVQAVVTSGNLFLSVEVRPGSWSDSKCWKYSKLGCTLYKIIPSGSPFIGDAGYPIQPGLIVSYDEREEGDYCHLAKKNLTTATQAQDTARCYESRITSYFAAATIVLHNLLIHFRDTTNIVR
ncbi:LOW QUALITY PROTEIN: hypothetical protein PHMEG_00026263 [Phytophthora megakarya]|uniref:DDE Tnp4 domain-containing protein n=1 Tax=Phytophthora megakarya TaxID=4795 RepID=A0A225VA06_9STRA|nr:LOW QUALITY PROTEIN: hypothetical protein PHMEG_00026263 [Phytophthora megakarya]